MCKNRFSLVSFRKNGEFSLFSSKSDLYNTFTTKSTHLPTTMYIVKYSGDTHNTNYMHLFMDVFDLVAGSLKLLINFAPLAKLNFSDDSDGAHLFEVQNIVDRQIISGCDELRRTETRHEEI